MIILFSPFSGLFMDALNPNPSLHPWTIKEKNVTRLENRNINNRRARKNLIKLHSPSNLNAPKLGNGKHLNRPNKQKRLLFKVHNLISVKEQNTALIYKLQCNIHTQYYKDHNSVICTSTKSSSIHSSSNIQNGINLLKDHNASLQKRNMAIKLSQCTFHSERISFLKNYHKGHRLRIQL